eukprot:GILK01002712.1.p1 GENE.GILK01002712.1~~GILK01002712.1.p1  ORF type:complete len:112 (+),score=8.24 GILK01002712.1:46-336(+)
MAKLRSCASCCCLMSALGFPFLLFLGIAIQAKTKSIEIEDEERDASAKGCFIAAAIYAGFLVLSLGYGIYHDNAVKKLKREVDRASGTAMVSLQRG